MYCRNCGQELSEGAAFCGNCGTPIMAQNRLAITPDAKEIAAASQEKNKGAKTLVIVILFLCVLVAVGIGGWFVIQKLSADRSDEEIYEEQEEEQADTREEEQADTKEEEQVDAKEVERADTKEEEQADTKEEEKASTKEAEEGARKEEKRDETGIHTYELIVEDTTWSQAYQNCLDRGGYLVRINSDEEYQAILQQIGDEDKSDIMFWLGGARESEESADYRWVYEDGTYGDIILNEEDTYRSYWLSGEPSYSDETGDMEMCMNMFYRSKEGHWVWNDVPDDIIAVADFYAGRVGYICEYEDE